MAMPPDEPRPESGAYVLGILDPNETADFEAHLTVCWICLEEVHSLGEVKRLLDRLLGRRP
ncbi:MULTISPECIES: hypothetical protein [Streptomyces]|uniref:Zinc-finger domain-containing protein n=2 Tax=Streptomyces TaxID=1883 RepID=A0ABV9IQJ2_9ACTN